MKNKCPICGKEKDNVGPKIIGKRYIDPKPPFTKRQLILDHAIMCEDCLRDYKQGKFEVKDKKSKE